MKRLLLKLSHALQKLSHVLHKLWRVLRRILVLLWFAAMFMLGGWLYLENPHPVTLNLFGLWQPEYALGALVCLTLAAGAVLGFFSSLLTSKTAMFWLRRRYTKATREVERLKALQNT